MEEIKRWVEKLEGVVEWSKAHPGSTLRELEEQVQKAIEQIQVELMETAVAQQGGGRVLEEERCECGGRWVFQGYRERWVTTREGAIRVRRAYYTCEHCGAGFFPPGSAVGDERGME
jgi:hypothetical protein